MVFKIAFYVFGLLLSLLLAPTVRSIRVRQFLVLLISYILYATWGMWFLGVLVCSSLMNYALGICVRRSPTPGRLWIGVMLNVLLLGFFKYLPAMAGAIGIELTTAGPFAEIIQPVGLSFWTFQALSYLFDLYREEELSPSILEFCLYMAFWPTVLSGPICRLPELLPQFRSVASPTLDDVGTGIRRLAVGAMMVGLAQVIGSGLRVGEGVNAGFDQISRTWGGPDVWCLAIGYGFLLFFDFAGYSSLAIGAARIFGICLPENFNRPYLCSTPSEFWTRWHMSLSFWIRDYLFLPLATVRRESWWRNLALIISMVIFGLWHKGSLLFVLWGCYHGLLLVMHRQLQQLQKRFGLVWNSTTCTAISWVITFAAMNLGWILFRAHDLSQVWTMLGSVLSPGTYSRFDMSSGFYLTVFLSVGGYLLVSLIDGAFDQYETRREVPGIAGRETGRLAGALEVIARERRVWAAPLVLTVSLYVLAVLLSQRSTSSGFLYMLF